MGRETKDSNRRGSGGPAIGIGRPSSRITDLAKDLDRKQVMSSKPKPKGK